MLRFLKVRHTPAPQVSSTFVPVRLLTYPLPLTKTHLTPLSHTYHLSYCQFSAHGSLDVSHIANGKPWHHRSCLRTTPHRSLLTARRRLAPATCGGPRRWRCPDQCRMVHTTPPALHWPHRSRSRCSLASVMNGSNMAHLSSLVASFPAPFRMASRNLARSFASFAA